MDSSLQPAVDRQFPCSKCGAKLRFAPGTTSLSCPYCHTENQIPQSPLQQVEPLDFNTYLDPKYDGDGSHHDQLIVRCQGCGAQTQFNTDVTAGNCPFCGAAIVAQGLSQRLIKPGGLLPFAVTPAQAKEDFRKWAGSLWFAPSTLASHAETTGITGVYLPCWTYDADTRSQYAGERGEDYWETESYTDFENGRAVTRTRQVLRTRWWPASGAVANRFDEVLIMATLTLPANRLDALQPWDLPNVVPYADDYLAGFACESYQIDLPQGFEKAKQVMDGPIRRSIECDIGGDHQRIITLNTEYSDVMFRHLLLPVWLSAYRYGDKTYRFMVNARTGEVIGSRPYSVMKIVLFCLLILAIIAGVVIFAQTHH